VTDGTAVQLVNQLAKRLNEW